MMSLFSSFDVLLYHWVWWVSLASGASLLLSFFRHSSLTFLISVMFSFMMHTFYSSKPSNYPKMMGTFLMSLFFLLMACNLWSVTGFNFPLTSQVSVVGSLSLSFWLSTMFYSLWANFKGTVCHFIPESTPMMLVPFLFLIEVISSLIRPITLSVRLVANILAGHLLMILLCQAVEFFSPLFVFYLLLNTVEMFVALIQSYIFVVMISLYFSEV